MERAAAQPSASPLSRRILVYPGSFSGPTVSMSSEIRADGNRVSPNLGISRHISDQNFRSPTAEGAETAVV